MELCNGMGDEYKTAAMVAATGVSLTRYQNWYAVFEELKPCSPAGVGGKLNLYSLGDLYKIALMKLLLDHGMPLTRAAEMVTVGAAKHFISDNPPEKFKARYLVFFDVCSPSCRLSGVMQNKPGCFDILPDNLEKHGNALVVDFEKFKLDIFTKLKAHKRKQ